MEKINFLFWNTNRANLYDAIVDLIFEYKIDLILLVECEMDGQALVNKINSFFGNVYLDNSFEYSPFKGLRIISRFENDCFTIKQDHERYSVLEISISNEIKFILGVCHLPSKLHLENNSDRRLPLKSFINDIEETEKELKTNNTVLIGDFNYDPYDVDFVSIDVLNSTMSKEIALTKSRNSYEYESRFFYNPMWSFFGESGKGIVNGTYYRNSGKNVNYFWHILDQVLLRSEMIDNFSENELEIIIKTNLFNFTRINSRGVTVIDDNFSDHLPLKFSLIF